MLSSLKRTGLSSATVVPASAADPSDTKLEAATLGFGISKDGLAEIVLEKDVNVLARYGGVKGVVRKLKADAEKGLRSDTVRRPPFEFLLRARRALRVASAVVKWGTRMKGKRGEGPRSLAATYFHKPLLSSGRAAPPRLWRERDGAEDTAPILFAFNRRAQ